MAVELVWQLPLNDGSGTYEARAAYATVAEALLQAAHNELVGGYLEQRVDEDGVTVADAAAISNAADQLHNYRETNGDLDANGQLVRSANYDSTAELESMGP